MKSKRPLQTILMMIIVFALCASFIAVGSGSAGTDRDKVTLDKVHNETLTIPEELKELNIKDSYSVDITLEEYVHKISIEKSHDITIIAKKGYGYKKDKDSYNINISTGVTPPSQHTIAASAGAGGSISPSGNVAVNDGANQLFTITPSTGYHIADVLVDDLSVGAVSSYTFTNVTANHIIVASFASNIYSYTITASAGAGGSISPSGAVGVNSGANQPFTIIPSTGYYIAAVVVDGSSVGAVASYTFTNVTANHTIAASFALTGSQALLVGAPVWLPSISPGHGAPYQVNYHYSKVHLPNRYFGTASDNNTAFRAVAEVATGDWIAFELPLKNASNVDLIGILTFNVPQGFVVEVYADNVTATRVTQVVSIGSNAWIFKLAAGADYQTADRLTVVISVDATMLPDHYDISGTIQRG